MQPSLKPQNAQFSIMFKEIVTYLPTWMTLKLKIFFHINTAAKTDPFWDPPFLKIHDPCHFNN